MRNGFLKRPCSRVKGLKQEIYVFLEKSSWIINTSWCNKTKNVKTFFTNLHSTNDMNHYRSLGRRNLSTQGNCIFTNWIIFTSVEDNNIINRRVAQGEVHNAFSANGRCGAWILNYSPVTLSYPVRSIYEISSVLISQQNCMPAVLLHAVETYERIRVILIFSEYWR